MTAPAATGQIDRFERIIRVEDVADPAIGAKLIEIAGKCPVHRTLEARSAVVTKFEPSARGDAGGTS